MVLEEYGVKHLWTGIGIYLHLSVSIAIIYFKHGRRYYAVLLFVKGMLALVSLHKLLISTYCFMQGFCNGTRVSYELSRILYKA